MYGTVADNYNFDTNPTVTEITENQFIKARNYEFNSRIDWLKNGSFFDIPENVDLDIDRCKYALRRYVDKLRDERIFTEVPYIFPGDEILAKQTIDFTDVNMPDEIEGKTIEFNIDGDNVVYTINNVPAEYPTIDYNYMDVIIEDMANTLTLVGYVFSHNNDYKKLIVEQTDGHGKEIANIIVSGTLGNLENVVVEKIDTRDSIQLRDERDRQNIQDNAIDGLGNDEEEMKVFMSRDNVAKYMTGSQMFEMAKFLKNRGSDIYTTAWTKKQLIENSNTYEEMRNINFDSEWPVD